MPVDADFGADAEAAGQVLIGKKRDGDISLTGSSGSSTLNGMGGNIQIVKGDGTLEMLRVAHIDLIIIKRSDTATLVLVLLSCNCNFSRLSPSLQIQSKTQDPNIQIPKPKY